MLNLQNNLNLISFFIFCFECLEIQEILAVIYAEELCELDHILVLNGIDARQMRREHVDLRRLLDGFDQTEGLVQILARAVDAVERPDNETELLHLLGGRLTDGVGAAEHPGQDTDAVGEHDDALGAHLPKSVGELLLVQLVDEVHREGVGRV